MTQSPTTSHGFPHFRPAGRAVPVLLRHDRRRAARTRRPPCGRDRGRPWVDAALPRQPARREVGETSILLHYPHHTAATSPYRASGPIFVREGVTQTASFVNHMPAQQRTRLLSVRAYDADGIMVDAEVAQGEELERPDRTVLYPRRCGVSARAQRSPRLLFVPYRSGVIPADVRPADVRPADVRPADVRIDPLALHPRHAGEACPGGGRGPVSTTSFVAAKEVVDTGMRRHDDVGIAERSIIRTLGTALPGNNS